MKKVLSLVLVAVLALSLSVVALADLNTVGGMSYVYDKNSGYSSSTSGGAQFELDGDRAGLANDDVSGGTLYLTDKSLTKEFQSALELNQVITGSNATNDEADALRNKYNAWGGVYIPFEGPSAYETTSYQIYYNDKNGSHTGSPLGVNGEELLKIRIGYDHEKRAYSITMTPVKNPTVEIFTDLQIDLKITKVLNRTTFSAEGFVWKGFSLMNKRYTSKDVYRDATGVYRINAGDKYPVVDESVFNKAYGGKLIVDYPEYRMIIEKVQNQDIAVNFEADLVKSPTVDISGNKSVPVLLATFHDIYVKDDLKIEFKVNADTQNYKSTTLYAYEVDSNGNPIKATEIKVTVTSSATIVMEIPAGTRLGAYGEVETMGTYGLYAEPQDVTESSSTAPSQSTSTGTGNPSTGASDVINVATVFAVVSLAAAGFVAVNKASK